MKRTEQQLIMDEEDANNLANKKVTSAVCDTVRDLLRACSQHTPKMLTPEHLLEVFQQLGIDAGEKLAPVTRNPFKDTEHCTPFGRLCRAAWLTGWRAGSMAHRSNGRKA